MSDEIKPIVMPKWGLAMQEGLVASWLVEEGAAIAAGQEILEIETSKIANVLESSQVGRLRRRVADAGETLPVGGLLGVLADDAVDDAAIDAFVARFQESFAARTVEAGEAAPEPATVEVEGRRIRYLELGGAGAGAPVVLIHGFGGDLTNWQYNQESLAERHRTIALDLPGHGGSSKEVGSGDVRSLARTLLATLDALEVEAARLVGHSLGAAVAVQAAREARERVRSLALVSPVGFGPEISTDYLEGFMGARRRKQMKPVLEMLVADPALIGREMVEDVLRYKRLDGVDQALRTIAGAVFPSGRQAVDHRRTIGDLGCPVLIVWGREDDIIPARHAEGLPGSVQVRLIDDAGHMAHLERAEDVNRLLGRHLGAG